MLILGCTPLAEQLIHEIASRPDDRHAVIGVLDDRAPAPGHAVGELFLGPLSCLETVVETLGPQRIVVALAERRGRMPVSTLVDCCASRGVIVEDATEFYERLTGKLAIESMTPMSAVSFGRLGPSQLQQALAQTLSLSTALLLLILLSPLLALIAVAIKLDSEGPVLFAQERVGRHGQPFTLRKFRTMQHGRARRSEWECDNRDQVTRVGRWLRVFRLDELPQFVNILRGEMNLVGPRPHPVSNLELFTLVTRNLNELTGAAISCYALRVMVRPGLTGWAQVRYRYANNLEEEIEKLRYDLHYIKHVSLWLDLRIILETIRVVIGGRVMGDETGSTRRQGLFGKVGRTTEA